jgi:hypothetical protein
VNSQDLGSFAPALCIAVAGACCFSAQAGVPGPVNAFGLQHTALGQAQLIDSGGTLTISNIGSSGKDGVSIDLGEAEGFECEVDFGPAFQLPPGMLYQFDCIATFGGPGAGQDQKALCAQFHETGGGLAALSLDLSVLNPGMLRVEVELDGQVLQTHEFGQPFPNPILIGELGTSSSGRGTKLKISNLGSSGKDGVYTNCVGCVDSFFDIFIDEDRRVSVGGGGLVTADAVIFTLLEMPAGSLPPPPFTRCEMRGAHTSAPNQFTIIDEALGLFGVTHRALGTAHMSSSGGTLTVSNIGSSGKDGVRQDPLPPGSQGNHYEFADLTTSDPFELAVVSTISLEGLPPGIPVTRTVELPVALGPVEMTVDFSGMGANTQTIEISLDGGLVFTQSGMSGVLAFTPNPPDISGLEGQDDAVIQTFSWLQPTPITVSGGPTILGDELRVIPEAGGGLGLPGFQEITGSTVLVSGDDSIVIVNQNVIPPPAPCPWDCELVPNGDVGVTDFLAMLAQWGQAGAPCDFDGGGVGVTDFLLMLGNWGACP